MFAGVAAAFTLHVAVAVTAGRLLAVLPHQVVQGLVTVLFTLGAVLLVVGRHGKPDQALAAGRGQAGFLRVAGMAFAAVLVAEFGDLTQLVTANLAAKYHDSFAVGLGAVLALWAVGGLAILTGQNLLRVVPMWLIIRVTALVMLALAAVSLLNAIHG